MIPRDDQYEVFVCEGVLVEVWRGERISVAQQFGVDWDGPTTSALHGSIFHVASVQRAALLEEKQAELAARLADLSAWQRVAVAVANRSGLAVRWWRSVWRAGMRSLSWSRGCGSRFVERLVWGAGGLWGF